MGPTFSTQHCSAVITGASSGLGAEFARQLAPVARSLALAARRVEGLETVKSELLAINPALTVHLCACDISTEEGRGRLLRAIDEAGVEPNLLINNAGAGDYGGVWTADAAKLRALIDLNITALVLLSHALLPKLKRSAASPAGILNVSSLAGTLPMPDLAVYAASKAFVTSFSEALAIEVRSRHVAVACVCPGPTPTNFSRSARRPEGVDTDRAGQGLLRQPNAAVVARALKALQQNEPCVYPGLGVALAAPIFRCLPRLLMRLLLQRRFAREHRSSSTHLRL